MMLQGDLPYLITRYFCLLKRALVQGLFTRVGERRRVNREAALGNWRSVIRKNKGLTDRPCRCLTYTNSAQTGGL